MSGTAELEAVLVGHGLPRSLARDADAIADHVDGLLAEDRHADVVKLLAPALGVFPDHWRIRSLAGWAMFKLGDKRAAEDLFFEAVRRGGGADEVAMLARCYAENGPAVAASVGLCRALRLPNPPPWLASREQLVEPVQRGAALLVEGRSVLRTDGASALLAWIARQDPELVDVDYDLRRLRGEAAAELGLWTEAADALAPLVLVAPDDGPVCLWAAEAWLETGQLEHALHALEAARPGLLPEAAVADLRARIARGG